MNKKADYCFEVSWEVCNKVGGIFTVVKSKAARMVEYYHENYYLIGPYFHDKALGQFIEGTPEHSFREAADSLKSQGITCHFGKWRGDGEPNVILIDFESFRGKINDIKKELWEYFKVDSIRAGNDYDEPVAFAYASGKVIESLSGALHNKKVVAHFHEWLSGAGLLYLKSRSAKVATVFTTHATILGRTLASSGIDIYNVWDKINPEEEAKKHSIESKFTIEKQSALNADAFTTVSEITAMEAEHMLGRKADVLVLNGLDIEKFPSFEDASIHHRIMRDKMREFLEYYFFPYYSFDLNQSLNFFTCARYEFHDKGINIMIKALGNLNRRLMQEKSSKTIVAFFFVPADVRSMKPEIIENRTNYQDIKGSFDDSLEDIKRNIMRILLSGKKISEETVFSKEFVSEVKGKLSRFKRKGLPPVCTHDLHAPKDDILHGLWQEGLNNGENSRVKVIFYPIYLTGADNLLNLSYYEAIEAGHLGIFPSYYEPWGYTPLEAGSLGVASVTTDLAGFGRFFCAECRQGDEAGIFIVKRLNKTEDDAVRQLEDVMYRYSQFSQNERIDNKLQARKIAATADWKLFIKNYIEAHNKAIEKAFG
ncbi:glycogen/starch synthase [Candidatus Woesearchaeota archaeon]|nr:glycogen/starch synthase [Candidatus Woesearchaeota archaeon]